MARVVLDSATATPLERTTVHNQFDGKAFGFRMLAKTVPIVLHVRVPGGSLKRAVLVFGANTQSHVPYKDLGEVDICCRKVYTFNIRHYIQCFVPSGNGSYTWNQCRVCGAAIVDDTGKHSFQQMSKRKFRRNRYIYRAAKTLQSGNNTEMFTPQEGLPRC